MYVRWAAGLARRPTLFLLANLLLAGLAAALAAGSVDRLAAAETSSTGPPGRTELVLKVRGEGLPPGVTRESLRVIRSGLAADPRVSAVTVQKGGAGGKGGARLQVRLGAETAAARQRDAERIPAGLDPGPLEVVPAGEPIARAEVREEVKAELPRLALLALPVVALVLVLGFGASHAAAPLLAAATGALGAIAVLGALATRIDLGPAGAAVAATVAVATGFEVSSLLRRRFAAMPIDEPAAMLAGCLRASGPRILAGCAGAALAALALLAVPLPAARSAALGGAGAVLLATSSALVAMPALLALRPRAARTNGAGGGPGRSWRRWRQLGRRLGRIRGLADRPALAWIPAIAAAAALVLAGTKAVSVEPPVLADRFWVAIGSIALAGLIAASLAGRGLRGAPASALGAALPAAAACGLLVLAADQGLPRALFEPGGIAHPEAIVAALAAVGAVSVLRSALGDRRGASIGTLAAAALLGVLALSEVQGVAQAGAAIATGLALDLVLVRLVLDPALGRGLSVQPPPLEGPGAPVGLEP